MNRTSEIDRLCILIILINNFYVLEDLLKFSYTSLDISLLILSCIVLSVLG